jgi:hypothetical protein
MQTVPYPSEAETNTDFGLKFSKTKEEKATKPVVDKNVVKNFYENNPDEDYGQADRDITKKQNVGKVPLDNIVISIDSGSLNIMPDQAPADFGGAVYGLTPNNFIFKNLVPIERQQLSPPRKFQFNYGASWFSSASYIPPFMDSFSMQPYLNVGILNYNKFTETGSIVPDGTAAATSAFTPLLNIKLNELRWINEGTSFGFLFDQPLTSIDLLDSITRDIVTTDLGAGIYNYAYDFRSDTGNNQRNKIDKTYLKQLLTSPNIQLNFGICIDNELLTPDQNLFLSDQITNQTIKFSLSFAFIYYARLLKL